MREQFISLRFWIEIAISVLVAVAIYIATRYYNRSSAEKDIKVDYFRVPTNNVLIVLGLLVPSLVTLASYLYVKDPRGNYASLLATIVLMFFVLIVAIWETFALLKKAQNGDVIKVKMPDDRKYIIGMGWMYASLLIGLIYFSIFFLFELVPVNNQKNEEVLSKVNAYYLLKPKIRINQPKEEVIKLWGQPISEDATNRKLQYESENSILQLSFDEQQKLVEIFEKRR